VFTSSASSTSLTTLRMTMRSKFSLPPKSKNPIANRRFVSDTEKRWILEYL
jgi:hypothetical protein